MRNRTRSAARDALPVTSEATRCTPETSENTMSLNSASFANFGDTWQKRKASTRKFEKDIRLMSTPRDSLLQLETRFTAVRVSSTTMLENVASWMRPSPTPTRIALQGEESTQFATVT